MCIRDRDRAQSEILCAVTEGAVKTAEVDMELIGKDLDMKMDGDYPEATVWTWIAAYKDSYLELEYSVTKYLEAPFSKPDKDEKAEWLGRQSAIVKMKCCQAMDSLDNRRKCQIPAMDLMTGSSEVAMDLMSGIPKVDLGLMSGISEVDVGLTSSATQTDNIVCLLYTSPSPRD